MAKGSKPTARNADTLTMGERFKEARMRAGVSLSRAAEHLGVSVNTIRWHEGGEMMLRVDTVHEAALLFNVHTAFLTDPTPRRWRRLRRPTAAASA